MAPVQSNLGRRDGRRKALLVGINYEGLENGAETTLKGSYHRELRSLLISQCSYIYLTAS